MAITHASACAVQHAAYYLAGAITKFEEADKELQKATHTYEEAFNYMTRCREGLTVAIARLTEFEEVE